MKELEGKRKWMDKWNGWNGNRKEEGKKE